MNNFQLKKKSWSIFLTPKSPIFRLVLKTRSCIKDENKMQQSKVQKVTKVGAINKQLTSLLSVPCFVQLFAFCIDRRCFLYKEGQANMAGRTSWLCQVFIFIMFVSLSLISCFIFQQKKNEANLLRNLFV